MSTMERSGEGFFDQIQVLRMLLPVLKGIELSVYDDMQLALITGIVGRVGCTYTVLNNIESTGPRYLVNIIGSKPQLANCMEAFLGYR